MAVATDFLEAKRTLSNRLLGAGLRGGAVAVVRSHSVQAALAVASRNVHAVGVGRKVVRNEVTPEPCRHRCAP